MQVGLAALLAGPPLVPGAAPLEHVDAVDGIVSGLGKGRRTKTSAADPD